MREIQMYYNEDMQDKVVQPINFGPVKAGEVTSKSIYIENTIDYPINFTFELQDNDSDIKLGKVLKHLKPNEVGVIELVFTPKITKMKPVEATLVTKISYLVE